MHDRNSDRFRHYLNGTASQSLTGAARTPAVRASDRAVSTIDLESFADEAETALADIGVAPEIGNQFFRHVAQRLATIRLQLCDLARIQGTPKRRVCLAGLSMQCQWLAGYARMGGFFAVSQVASALEGLMRHLHEVPDTLTDAVLRTAAQAADLLTELASTSPDRAGRAEGARVMVLDEESRARLKVLSTLERFQISAIGISSTAAAMELLHSNEVDLVILRSGLDAKATAKFCQFVRQIALHKKTPLLVLSPRTDWESRAVLAVSGASEVVSAPFLPAELGLKALCHFFRSRIGGPGS